MYEPHGWVRAPSDLSTVIWRYFKLPYFLDLVTSRELYFTRLDRFQDQSDGTLPRETAPLAKDRFTNLPIHPEDELTDFQMLIRDQNRLTRLGFYASCWYTRPVESDPMWRLYGQDIAVRTSVGSFCDCFRLEPSAVHIGKVHYYDFANEQAPTYGNTLSIAFNKSNEFEDERELRAVVTYLPAGWISGTPPYHELKDIHPDHRRIAVDLNALIESVSIAPGRFDEISTVVIETLERVGLSKPVRKSSLDRLPPIL